MGSWLKSFARNSVTTSSLCLHSTGRLGRWYLYHLTRDPATSAQASSLRKCCSEKTRYCYVFSVRIRLGSTTFLIQISTFFFYFRLLRTSTQKTLQHLFARKQGIDPFFWGWHLKTAALKIWKRSKKWSKAAKYGDQKKLCKMLLREIVTQNDDCCESVFILFLFM